MSYQQTENWLLIDSRNFYQISELFRTGMIYMSYRGAREDWATSVIGGTREREDCYPLNKVYPRLGSI